MLEYNVIKLSFECLIGKFFELTNLFFKFSSNNVVLIYYSLVAKKRYNFVLVVIILNLKGHLKRKT